MRWLSRARFPAAFALVFLAALVFEARASDVQIQSWRYKASSEPEIGNGPHLMGPGGATRLKLILDQTGPTALTRAMQVMSGGAFTCTLLVNAPGCTPPSSITIQAQTAADDDTATVNWATACVFPGDCVTLKLNSSKGPLVVHRSFWGNGVQDSIAPAVGCARFPSASPRGMGTLATFIALAGAWVLVRSRRAQARA